MRLPAILVNYLDQIVFDLNDVAMQFVSIVEHDIANFVDVFVAPLLH